MLAIRQIRRFNVGAKVGGQTHGQQQQRQQRHVRCGMPGHHVEMMDEDDVSSKLTV